MMAAVPASLNVADAARRRWDAVVIGAGPAGAVAARVMAQRGAAVLLVDKASFPRPKVCGGCLSSAALDLLGQANLSHIVRDLGAPVLDTLQWHYGRWCVQLGLPAGAIVSRRALDAALVRAALAAGVTFVPNVSATVGEVGEQGRMLQLRSGAMQAPVMARVVIAASGLAGAAVCGKPHVARRSWIGLGTSLPALAEGVCRRGEIRMCCGRRGYVGMAQLAGGCVNVAAALDPLLIRECGGAAPAVRRVLHETGVEVVGLDSVAWRGTPLLSQRPAQLGLRRLLLIGDAAGYVEPFTGEGITWALASALAVVEPALGAVQRWRDTMVDDWTMRHRQLLSRQQAVCAAITGGLRIPALAGTALGAVRWFPGLGARAAGAVHAPVWMRQ